MKHLLPLILVAAAPVLSSCQKQPGQPGPSRSAAPPASVVVQAAEQKPYTATEDVVGTVRPKLSAAIEAKVSGRIEKMLAVPGQTVTAGELLIQLDAHETQAHYDQAAAVRQQAQSDLKRASDLFQQKILSQSEFDAAQSKFRVADAAASEAETLLGYTRITAPFDGVITRKFADVGDLAMPGKTLLQMENPKALRLEADVPEALISRLALGDKLAVRGDVTAGEIEGTVAEISPAADANSRTFLVKLDLPATAGLRSGQFGRVAVPTGEVDSILVPHAAVVQRGQMEMVFVVNDGRAELRLVKTGRQVDGEVEIVSGLDAGERIVTEGAADLTDGQPVVAKSER